MNKQLLSHYGWIIITTLVFAIMIAFVTPFGEFVGNAVVNITGAYRNINRDAIDEDNIDEMSAGFKDKLEMYAEKDDTDKVSANDGRLQYGMNDPDLNHSKKIPKGGKYFVYATSEGAARGNYDNATAIYTEGQSFPTPNLGDVYVYGDYEYRIGFEYDNGWTHYASDNTEWAVSVIDNSKETYDYMLESVAGLEVKNMCGAFWGCAQLTKSPIIHQNISGIANAFYGCTSLAIAPIIPDGVTDMINTFYNCSSLTTAPAIPDSVTNMESTFMFCKNLTVAPAIPDSVTYMGLTFGYCEKLTVAPKLPKNVTDMSETFSGCTSLTTAPTIPNSVTCMISTFAGCANLTGTIEINANPTSYSGCFYGVNKPITLVGSSSKLSSLAETSGGSVTVG